MKFTENFRIEFQKQLKENKNSFKEDSIAFVKANIETPYRFILKEFCKENYPYYLDYEKIVKEINLLFQYPGNFKFQLRNDFSYMDPFSFDNEIYFRSIDNLPSDIYYTDRYYDYMGKTWDLWYDCGEEFWKDIENKKKYQAISDFSCFLDLIFPQVEIKQYQKKGDIINEQGWLSYYKDLLKLFFPEFLFSEKLSTKKMLRFVKPISNDVYFGFEYDESYLRTGYRHGELQFPGYLNLILVNKGFIKGIKKEEYIFNYSDDILSLGMLNNPLFYQGNFSAYVLLDRTYIRGTPQNNKFKYFREYLKINENEMQIVHPEGLGEKLKRFAFFYMNTLAYSSKSYLAFIEKEILNVVSINSSN